MTALAALSTPLAWYAPAGDRWETDAHTNEAALYGDLAAAPYGHLAGLGAHLVLPAVTQSRRTKEAVTARTLLVVDLDDWEDATLDAVAALTLGYRGLVHTTKSHQAPGKGPRYRAVLAVSDPMTVAQCDVLKDGARVLQRARRQGAALSGLDLLLSWADPSTLLANQCLYPPQYTATGLYECEGYQGNPVDTAALVASLEARLAVDSPSQARTYTRKSTSTSAEAHTERRVSKYVTRIMDTLEGTGAGGRHEAINLAAYNMGAITREYPEYLDTAEARGLLVSSALAMGKGDEARTVDDGLAAGASGGHCPDFRDHVDDWDDTPRGPGGGQGGGGGGGGTNTAQNGQGGPRAPQGPPTRAPILLRQTAIDVSTREILDALGAGPVYESNGRIVWISHDKGGASTHGLDKSGLVPVMAGCAVFQRWRNDVRHPDGGEFVDSGPSTKEAAMILGLGHWPALKQLQAIVHAPVLLGSGEVLQAPGFDSPSGIYLDPTGIEYPPIPEVPTADDVAQAVALIDTLHGGCRFAADTDRAAAVALLLELVARPLLGRHNTPLYFACAALPGAGKSVLLKLSRLAVTGQAPNFQGWPSTEEERKKALFHTLLNPGDHLFWDNVKGTISDPTLELALTSSTLDGRILGGASVVSVNTCRTYALTSNGPAFSQDVGRRAVQIALRPPPLTGATYAIPDVEGWATENHPRLLWAVLVLWRAWMDAGAPLATAPAFPSFEAWSATVRSCVRFHGWADPVGDRAFEAEGEDPRTALARLLDAWPGGLHVALRAVDVVALADGRDTRGHQLRGQDLDDLKDALGGLPISQARDGYGRRLGAWLSSMEDVSNGSGYVLGHQDQRIKRSKGYIRKRAV